MLLFSVEGESVHRRKQYQVAYFVYWKCAFERQNHGKWVKDANLQLNFNTNTKLHSFTESKSVSVIVVSLQSIWRRCGRVIDRFVVFVYS
ncbi:hypothetical protein VNO78_02940 [Psophocarpus tetragonolobus]|uniref:Uncharacterized protein n=1 Tax=Psophocarpus tetragonolobus TaxID=3891 RepID=A0AAN9TBX0_PSOTE